MKESELPKEYAPSKSEAKWQKIWEENQIYRFRKDHRPNFVIDTPPPFTSGELHMGHVLNFVFIDVVARYKRMRGFNVYYPQGWDCHGLHTELKVESIHNITKHDVSKEQFKKYCIELTERFIDKMKAQLKAIGYSPDWNYEYRTMDPDYIKRVQLTFLDFYKRGLIYRAEHPVNWCPRCETAIANAEVEYETRITSLNYIKFLIEGKPVSIATTRPELLCACVAVAVHPNDDRYKDLIGKKAVVPIYNKSVPIIADPDVDPSFGTGIVMICTFGDKQDVEWRYRHNLPVIKAIDQKGIMTEAAGSYAGLSIEECKTRIVRDLERDWLLEKTEPLEQNVAAHERCGTPIEFLITLQWFAKAREFKDEVITAGK
ncbi:MAG: class I tRNA ligase family protein, partial [Euryarchaeota archaeon]|nr:class I tRNA ligase family protein [Euryarchaeota archaeon]